MNRAGGATSRLFHNRFIPLWLSLFAVLLFGVDLAAMSFRLWLAISQRISISEVVTFADIYPSLAEGELLAGTGNARWNLPWDLASAQSFRATA